ncbi:MAG TPA: hypothetical protein VLL97_01705 [Acidobacteriota bacterium]|nr:hypothetical protein [Acidobacteriota bacterium]
MPTDLELIESFVNMSADARGVLETLVDFATKNQTITFNLSGGSTYSIDSLPKLIATFDAAASDVFTDFEKNFGGVYSSTITRDALGRVSGGAITFQSAHVLEITYTRATTGLLASVAWALKDGGTTLASGTKTLTRNSSGQITAIA